MNILTTEIKPKDEWTKPYRLVIHTAEHKANEIVLHLETFEEKEGEMVSTGYHNGYYFPASEIDRAIHTLIDRMKPDKLRILWEDMLVRGRYLYKCHVDHHWGEDDHEFTSEEDVVAFKRKQLEEFYLYQDYPDVDEVCRLLKEGEVDEAFDIASHHADEQDFRKFGHYDFTEVQEMHRLGDLDEWLLKTVIEKYDPPKV